jgi:hypothetical protein
MKNLISIIAISFVAFMGCTKDQQPIENVLHYKFNETYIEHNHFQIKIFSLLENSFSLYAYNDQTTFDLEFYSSDKPFENGTYNFAPENSYFASIKYEGKYYYAGKKLVSDGYIGAGKFTFTKYDKNNAEGTFEFSSDQNEPFAIREGYFKIQKK